MRVNSLIAGIALLIIASITTFIFKVYMENILANGDALISSTQNAHLVQAKVKDNQGGIMDRDGLEWPADLSDARSELGLWENTKDASDMLDGVYHLLYGTPYGITGLEFHELYGKRTFSAADGISDLYTKKGNDVYITVSSLFNKKLNKALKDSGADNGAAVMMNYKTGEILGWTSIPSVSSESGNTQGGDIDWQADRALDGSGYSININEIGQIAGISDEDISPYHLCLLTAIIANGRAGRQPYIVSRIAGSGNASITLDANPKNPEYLSGAPINISQPEAAALRAGMKNACAENGKDADLGSAMKKLGYTAAAKSSSGSISWIACFLEEKPFALAIAVQGANDGEAAKKIASEILPFAIDMNLDQPVLLK